MNRKISKLSQVPTQMVQKVECYCDQPTLAGLVKQHHGSTSTILESFSHADYLFIINITEPLVR